MEKNHGRKNRWISIKERINARAPIALISFLLVGSRVAVALQTRKDIQTAAWAFVAWICFVALVLLWPDGERDRSVRFENDLVAMEVTDQSMPARVDIFQRGVRTGKDFGVLTQEGSRLIFRGQLWEFCLTTNEVHDFPRASDGPHFWFSLALNLPNRDAVVCVFPVPRSEIDAQVIPSFAYSMLLRWWNSTIVPGPVAIPPLQIQQEEMPSRLWMLYLSPLVLIGMCLLLMAVLSMFEKPELPPESWTQTPIARAIFLVLFGGGILFVTFLFARRQLKLDRYIRQIDTLP